MVDARVLVSSSVFSLLGTDGCGARVPCLIWVLEPVGFGDVMIDGVCPAGTGAAARSFRDLRSETGVTGLSRELAAAHQELGLDAPSHRSGLFFPSLVAEVAQDVMDPAGQFAGHRQRRPVRSEPFFDLEVVVVVG